LRSSNSNVEHAWVDSKPEVDVYEHVCTVTLTLTVDALNV
jgi:hypothetical protein